MSLGRGLESLIPKKNDDDSNQNASGQPIFLPEEEQRPEITGPEPTAALPRPGEGEARAESETARRYHHRKKLPEAVFQIEVEKIKPNPLQPRREFDEEGLKELAASIREHGLIQPLVVSKTEKETPTGTDVEYQLITGERRLRAAKLLGWERVPAIVRNVDSRSERLEMAIIENLQRENLNPVEVARAYAKLQDEFGLTQREIASRLGKSRETVANTVRLLNLPTEIQDALAKNQINESQARLLLVIPDLNEQQNLFRELLTSNLSVRELKNRIRKSRPPKTDEAEAKTEPRDPEIRLLQERLADILGAKVDIEKNKAGGKIIISFYSPEEIQGIIEKIIPHPEE